MTTFPSLLSWALLMFKSLVSKSLDLTLCLCNNRQDSLRLFCFKPNFAQVFLGLFKVILNYSGDFKQ